MVVRVDVVNINTNIHLILRGKKNNVTALLEKGKIYFDHTPIHILTMVLKLMTFKEFGDCL